MNTWKFGALCLLSVVIWVNMIYSDSGQKTEELQFVILISAFAIVLSQPEAKK